MGSPVNDFEALKRHFDREEAWNKATREQDKERALRIVEMIPRDASSILDVGCGSGLIANMIGPSRFTVGFDLSRIALCHVEKERVEGACPVLPFADHSFDMIIAAEILEHLGDITLHKTLDEFQRVSRKYILVSVPFEEDPRETFVKCAMCGYAYSPYGHRQYFDIDRVQQLIVAKRRQLQLTGHKKVMPRLRIAGEEVLGVYPSQAGSTCPRCGSDRLEYGRLARLYTKMVSALQRVFAKDESDTIVCLYELV
jgi:ubiquinone/menaquinone biosynthesis C-methylase UbiE